MSGAEDSRTGGTAVADAVGAPPGPAGGQPAAEPGHPAEPGYGEGILNHGIATELDRLRRLETELDPASRALLDRLGVRDGQRFLEAGAGAGSLAYWLADRFPAGHVTAVDVDTR